MTDSPIIDALAVVVGPAPLDPRATTTMVEMADGVRLATDIYHPRHTSPQPTVLVRLPYDKCGRFTFMPAIAGYLVAHGFAVVVQDVRGKFRSEGVLEPFVNEAQDGASTLDWIVDQPWSSGAVGMLGDSYYGFTQWAAAATSHPALRAIVPRVTGSGLPEMFSPSHVPRVPLFEWIAATFSGPGLLEYPFATHQSAPAISLPQDVEARVLEIIQTLSNSAADGTYETRCFPGGAPAPRLAIPALHVGGWWDNLKGVQLDDWCSATQSPAAEHQFLRMNVTDHEDYEWHEIATRHHDHEVDRVALDNYLPRLLDEPIAFLDHYLGGSAGPWRAPRVRYRVAHADWQVSAEWPPLDVEKVSFVLTQLTNALNGADGGRLVIGGKDEGSLISWTHDPKDPVPFLAESEWGQLAQLPDEQHVHTRRDVATFTTESAVDSYDLVGPISASLLVGATSRQTHVIARLLDVYPSGAARLIAEGATVTEMVDLPRRVNVDLGHTAYRVRPGHKLRLAISSSCFPLYAVYPGNDGDVWSPEVLEQAVISLAANHGEMPELKCGVRGMAAN